MINSNNWFYRPASKKIFLAALCLLLFVGFLDAAYLTVSHYSGNNAKCFISQGCDIVTTSKYATVGRVPIALVGGGYYALTLTLVWLYEVLGSGRILSLIRWIVGSAFVVSLYLVYLQLFVIHAICIYCITSASITSLSFLILLLMPKPKLPS